MFDHIVLRRAESGDVISIGQIAEALLYYQRVHLVIDRDTLVNLIKSIGTQGILKLLQRPEISAVYNEELLVTYTETVGAFQMHRCEAITITGHESVGTFKTIEERVHYLLADLNIDKSVSRKFTKKFIDKVPVRKFSGNHYLKGGVSLAAKHDLLDADFIKLAVRHLLPNLPGGYDPGPDLKFDAIDSPLGVHVFHNIDFSSINSNRKKLSSPTDDLTIAHLISFIQDARSDIALASFYGGDFVTSQARSSIVQVRHAEFLRRTALNLEAQCQFTEVVLPDTPSVAEVINGGERSIDEFFLLLDKAGRFKHWLRSVNPDEGLIRTYLKDVSSEDWIQRLPAKTARYIFTLALDSTNPIVGLASGFIDNFLVEKLLGGWRPNHFISGRLGPFTAT